MVASYLSHSPLVPTPKERPGASERGGSPRSRIRKLVHFLAIGGASARPLCCFEPPQPLVYAFHASHALIYILPASWAVVLPLQNYCHASAFRGQITRGKGRQHASVGSRWVTHVRTRAVVGCSPNHHAGTWQAKVHCAEVSGSALLVWCGRPKCIGQLPRLHDAGGSLSSGLAAPYRCLAILLQ